jgi:hypothetical protein
MFENPVSPSAVGSKASGIFTCDEAEEESEESWLLVSSLLVSSDGRDEDTGPRWRTGWPKYFLQALTTLST